jgi:Ca2+:H+ antiporter
MSAAMLALAVIGLVFPALFHGIHGPPNQVAELYLSEAVATILIITYGLSLLFSLKTHRALFGGGDHPAITPKWGVGAAVAILALATAGIVVQSEILVHVVGDVTKSIGLSQTFLGLVIVPLIGNAAEHATAVVVARKGQTDLAVQIALGSSTQVALLIAPLLVFIGIGVGTQMDLVFPTFDVVALGVSTIVVAIITLDGETHWFEGAQLLAVYALMAAAAFFI